MKLAIVVQDLGFSGGFQKLVIRLAQEWQKDGHQVIVYTPCVDKKACFPDIIKTIKITSLRTKPYAQGGGWNTIKLLLWGPITNYRRMKQLVSRMDKDFDGIVLNDPLSLLTLYFYKGTKPFRSAWMINNQVLPGFGRWYRPFSEIRSLKAKPKSMLLKIVALPVSLFDTYVTKRSLHRLNEFATYDKHNKQLVESVIGRAATVVFAGADLENFRRLYKSRQILKKKSHKILSVGIVAVHRRYEDLLEAIALLVRVKQDITAEIIGLQSLSPKYFNDLLSLRSELNLDSIVTFTNNVTDKEMLERYKSADVFAFINDAETWGVAAFEAVSAGLPVIITSNIGAADLIKKNRHGWVVKSRKPKQVARAIEDVFSSSTKTRKIVKQAFNEVTPVIMWSAYASRMLRLLDRQ